ncbi:TOBE domain-containing protein [Rathayibacter oskolensis]|uniref:extracellular solute-binding protein n=1 Tax=Rathayibacter oskolensis TaxID=1891671 RepID=UPI00265F09B5|nr:extracellular solute-binding protein [Rathayibacter oskolensis]WKK72153.1 TOBE domain-containing protein [Rathayibacter oskolensis]
MNRPSVLLLDEPLGALDRQLREEMQMELKLLQTRLGITFVFVTHDQGEAMSMSDRIAVMRDGRIEQLADANTVYHRPASAYVAAFVGQQNFLAGVVGDSGALVTPVATISGATAAGRPGETRQAAIRPESIRIHAAAERPAGGVDTASGRVLSIANLGETVQYLVHLDAEHSVLVRRPRPMLRRSSSTPRSPSAGPARAPASSPRRGRSRGRLRRAADRPTLEQPGDTMTAKHPVNILAPAQAVPIIARELSRRRLFGVAGGVGATAFLAACSSPGAGSAPEATGGALEGDLSIYTWGDYDSPDVIAAFTSTEGPQITLDSYSSNEELLSKLGASKGTSGYDIVVPTGIFVPGMIENGLLAKFSKDLIPNLAKVDPQFLGQAWDPDNEYTVCKNWGTTGFAYDTTVITRDLVTWSDFLDAVQNEASGKTSFLDDPIEIVAPYFWANGIDYTTESEDDYAAAETFMVEKIAPHIAAFESYPGGSIIPQNTQVLVQSWNGDARLGKLNSEDPERWKWVLGSPTTELWMDNWAIAAGPRTPRRRTPSSTTCSTPRTRSRSSTTSATTRALSTSSRSPATRSSSSSTATSSIRRRRSPRCRPAPSPTR